jgi:hypothetical protein
MKRLLLTLIAVMGLSATYAQNGSTEVLTPPTTNSAYILVDTLFTLEESPVGYTEVYLHFSNPTQDEVKAVQFQINYDTDAFGSAQIFWGPTALSVSDKYGSFFDNNGVLNVIASYTGNSTTFDWANGAMFKMKLNNAVTYNAESDSIFFDPSTTYQSVYTTGNGVDNALGLHSYGGNFQMPLINYPIHVYNADSSDAQGVWYSAFSRHKDSTQLGWTLIETDSTDSDGLAIISTPLDTTKHFLRIVGQTDTMSDGFALSITDAYKLANQASQQDTLKGMQWLQGDINESGDITISDAFAMFNRLALSQTDWNNLISGVHNVTWLTPADYLLLKQSVEVPDWTTWPRSYAIDTIMNGSDSALAFIYVVGDVTNTGYNNPAVLVAKMADPGVGTDYILDPAVYMTPNPDTVEFRIPKLTMTEDYKMRVPVTMYTYGNKIGAAQMGIEFDTTIFEFTGIETGDATSRWNSLLTINDGEVFWAGHEDAMNPSLVDDMTQQFVFNFDVKVVTGWQTSPLRIVNKAAGSENAEDLNIKPSPNDGSVVNRVSIDDALLELMEGFKVYPNPTTELVGHWLVFEYHIEEKGHIDAIVYDNFGREAMRWSDEIYEKGFQFQGFTMESLPNGIYYVNLVTADRNKTYKIIKK